MRNINTNTHNYIPAGLGRTWVGGERILAATARNKGFPGGSDGKVSTCNMGDLGSIPRLGRFLGGGHGNPLQYSCLENPHGQRSLAGYSPWGHKELDTTERLSTAQQEINEKSFKCCILFLNTLSVFIYKCLLL